MTGKANGHSNGHSHSNGDSETQTHTAGGHLKLQYHAEKNITWFWVLAAVAGMTVVPIFIYWCWICMEFNEGRILLPSAYTRSDISTWWYTQVWNRILQHALPTWYAAKIYVAWLAFQAVLFHYGPGPVGYGAALDHLDGQRLPYKYNGQFAWIVTLILAITLHFTNIFPLTELVDNYAPLLSVCIITTSVVIALLHIWAAMTNGVERPSNSILYDYFMGSILNPRIGSFDIKFFFELRPGIMHWYFTTLGFAAKQYEETGTLSTPMALLCFYHLCFVNACYKGEQCVPHSIDIIYEKFGWMLCMLDIVMVPFGIPMQAFYVYKIGLYEHSTGYTVFVFLMHVLGYWMFDTANSQKDYFREKPEEEIAKGFPRLPWDKIQNPKYLKTERGSKLLLSGWWAHARHMNYLGDIMMSWTWGFTCGFGSYFPYAYTTYLTPLLLHRLYRDDAKCQAKYGKDWDKYCKLVPYRLIPYVY